MTKKGPIEGAAREAFFGVPHRGGLTDEETGLAIQGKSLETLQRIDTGLRDRPLTPEVLVCEAPNIAREMAPHFQDAIMGGHLDADFVADAVQRGAENTAKATYQVADTVAAQGKLSRGTMASQGHRTRQTIGQGAQQTVSALGQVDRTLRGGFGALYGQGERAIGHLAGIEGYAVETVDELRGVNAGIQQLDKTTHRGFQVTQALLGASIVQQVISSEMVRREVAKQGEISAALLRKILVNAIDISRETLARQDTSDQTAIEIGVRTTTAIREGNAELQAIREHTARGVEVQVEIRDELRVPEFIRAFRARYKEAENFRKRGSVDRAIESYEAAYAQNKGDHSLNYKLGRCREHQEDYSGAAQMFNEAFMQADDPNLKAHYKTHEADAHVNAGDLENAKSCIDEALTWNDKASLHLHRAIIYTMAEEFDVACEALQKAIILDGEIILKIMNSEALAPLADRLLEQVYLPVVLAAEELSDEALYFITKSITESESSGFPPEEVKAKLAHLWKERLKKAFQDNPREVVSNPYLREHCTPLDGTTVIEVASEVIGEGLPQYQAAEDYYFVSSLLVGLSDESKHLAQIYQLMKAGLEKDSRADDAAQFEALTSDISKMAGSATHELLGTIAGDISSEFRAYKKYLRTTLK